MKNYTIIIAEHTNNHITPSTYELVTFARSLETPEIEIIILGKNIETLSNELGKNTGLNVTGIQGDHLESFHLESCLDALMGLIKDKDPAYICLPHSSFGYDLAPAIAARTGKPCISAIQEIRGNTLTRAMFGGKILADLMLPSRSAVFTVLPGAFASANPTSCDNADITILIATALPNRTRHVGIKESSASGESIANAEVIVSGGRGMGSREDMYLLQDLASLFAKSAVGASRIPCDLGWIEHSHQVGITGQSVTPKLYIACGISGSAQHLSGMKDSQIIIAINTDPGAAIFSIAHYCIVDDLRLFIPIFIQEYKKRLSSQEKGID